MVTSKSVVDETPAVCDESTRDEKRVQILGAEVRGRVHVRVQEYYRGGCSIYERTLAPVCSTPPDDPPPAHAAHIAPANTCVVQPLRARAQEWHDY